MSRIAHNRTVITWVYGDIISGTTFSFVREAEKSKGGRRMMFCRCECGSFGNYDLTALRTAHTKSCKECRTRKASEAKFTHGHCTGKKSTTYKTWLDMKTRCTSANHRDFHHYGGRGITVCDRWLNSFENFLEDMQEKPDNTYTIERVNVNGNYEPSNCKWIPKSEQWKTVRNLFGRSKNTDT